MEKEDVAFLNQLVKSLNVSEKKLEEAYLKKDVTKFNEIKKLMLKIQQEISGVIA